MDETSSYQAATQVRQESEPAISDIYAQATSLKSDLTGGSDEYFETSGDKNQVFQLGSVTTEENQDINATTPFSITVNGSTAASGVQTSPFTLDCVAGTGEYPARSTGTSPQVVTYASPTGVSVAPPASGTTMFVVYAKVTATMTATAGVDVATTGTIVISETSAAADKVGSVSYTHLRAHET